MRIVRGLNQLRSLVRSTAAPEQATSNLQAAARLKSCKSCMCEHDPGRSGLKQGWAHLDYHPAAFACEHAYSSGATWRQKTTKTLLHRIRPTWLRLVSFEFMIMIIYDCTHMCTHHSVLNNWHATSDRATNAGRPVPSQCITKHI